MEKIVYDLKKYNCILASKEKQSGGSQKIKIETKYSISAIPVVLESAAFSKKVEEKNDTALNLQTCSVGQVEEINQLISNITCGDKVASTISSEIGKYEGKGCALFPFSPKFSEGQAGYIGFFAKALFSLRKAKIELGTKVLVIGQGMQGIIMAQAAGYFGADVMGLDSNKDRISIAKTFEIPQLFLKDKDIIEQVRKKTNNYGFDVIFIECFMGDEEIWRVASDAVRPGGSIFVNQKQFNCLDTSLMQKKDINLCFTTQCWGWEDYFSERKITYPDGYVEQDSKKDHSLAVRLILNKKINVTGFEEACFTIPLSEIIEKGIDTMPANKLCIKLIFNP